jgi:diguanylate cyclase (GGDEF)-like protein
MSSLMTGSDSSELGRHLACTITLGIIRRVRSVAGQAALDELLEAAHTTRTLAYLEDIANWVSRDEAMALFEAAKEIAGDPEIARHVGEDATRQYSGTPVATTLRSLGSVEEMLRQIAVVVTKFSVVSSMEVVEVSPGHALLRRCVREDFAPHAALCEWAQGLLSSAPQLYGIPPASVDEVECQCHGDAQCLFSVSWDSELAARTADPSEHIAVLESELAALNESLESMYAVAGDLIADDDLKSTLAKITERSASAVRAPGYLLVVRPNADDEPEIYSRGLAEADAQRLAEQVLTVEPGEADERWLMADIRSRRRHYGRIVALFDRPQSFFLRERRTLEHYARYAANALDLSLALAEARQGHAETRALLDFARSLVGAPRLEVARRLADAIPHLVDCDRVAVLLEQGADRHLRCCATHGYSAELAERMRTLEIVRGEADPELGRELFAQERPRALFFGLESNSPFVQEMFVTFGSMALAIAPIITRGKVLGAIGIAVTSHPERLRETRELQDRLSGIAAQAAVGIENGELIERVTYQARHDPLTGLVNRSFFAERFEQTLDLAREASEPLGLFYVDLDEFKQINDYHGHETGDEVLRQVATRLLAVVRAHDTVARLGGDEFAIILREVADRSQVDAAVERVAGAFSAPFWIGDMQLGIRASVGRAVWPYDGDELGGLLSRADASMYEAKRALAPRPNGSLDGRGTDSIRHARAARNGLHTAAPPAAAGEQTRRRR